MFFPLFLHFFFFTILSFASSFCHYTVDVVIVFFVVFFSSFLLSSFSCLWFVLRCSPFLLFFLPYPFCLLHYRSVNISLMLFLFSLLFPPSYCLPFSSSDVISLFFSFLHHSVSDNAYIFFLSLFFLFFILLFFFVSSFIPSTISSLLRLMLLHFFFLFSSFLSASLRLP